MTTYTWTDDMMRSGSTCDVDKVADNLMYLKYDNIKSIPFCANSGNLDSSGNADLFSYVALPTISWTSPNMTSRSNSDGYVVTGDYVHGSDDRCWQMFNATMAQDLNAGTYAQLAFPSNDTIYVNSITIYSSGSGAYYSATLATVTFYKNGSVVGTQSNLTVPASGSITYPITTVNCDAVRISGLTGSQNGYEQATGGFSFSGYMLNPAGGTGDHTTLSYKVGGSYANLKITYADLSSETLTGLTSISGLTTNGTYTIIKEQGLNPIVSTNSITMGKVFPTSPVNGDYHCLTATELKTYKYTTNTWVETQYVVLGTIVVSNNVISSVTTNPYNQNNYEVNKAFISKLSSPSSNYINLTYTGANTIAQADGYIYLTVTSSGGGQEVTALNYSAEIGNSCLAYGGGNSMCASTEVQKGQTYVLWTNCPTVNQCVFVYKEGSKQ